MSRRTALVFFGALMLVVSTLSACGSRSSNRSRPCADKLCDDPNDGEAMTPTTGAGGDHSNSSDAPLAPQTCRSTNDCPAAMYCDLVNEVCVTCLIDAHCSTDDSTVCREGACISLDEGSCSHIDQCEGSLVCEFNSGSCVQCTTNAHCPHDGICENNQCVRNETRPSCATQGQCEMSL